MPLLFFALASASSESASSEPCASLALHAGSNGWQSARCCSYPQELLLRLERGAEIHEIEITARGDTVPGSVEVYLSSGDDWNDSMQHACTLEMQSCGFCTARSTRKAKTKLFALCSGYVKLLVHEPLHVGPSNPYKQVSLCTVDLWGCEDVLPRSAKAAPVDLGEQHEEIASVLMDLGVPLSLIPVDEDVLSAVDVGTQALVKELRAVEEKLLEERKFGEAQQLEEALQQVSQMGVELQRLQQRREALFAGGRLCGDPKELEHLGARIKDLEKARLQVAALYDTDWWLSKMSMGEGGTKSSYSISPDSSPLGMSAMTGGSFSSHPAMPEPE
ncbi:unnamed protein product [Effrenium voratum]|nr:unnamed protein product [Effrenium voratum]